eukprot:1142212-Pelagomonas_calceolata.AAC.2
MQPITGHRSRRPPIKTTDGWPVHICCHNASHMQHTPHAAGSGHRSKRPPVKKTDGYDLSIFASTTQATCSTHHMQQAGAHYIPSYVSTCLLSHVLLETFCHPP